MNSHEFSRLVELVKLDKELYQFFSERAALISHLENIEIDTENIQKDVETIYKKLKDLQKYTCSLETDLKFLDAQEIEKNKQVNKAVTTRQYYSLEHELEEIKKKRDQLENQLFNVLNQLQELEALYQNSVLNAKEKKENLTKDMQNTEKRLYDVDKQINAISHTRDDFELQLKQSDPELLEQYIMVKNNVCDPAVKLRDISCSACFYQLTLSELSKIKEHKIIKCQSCYRFIYL